MQHLKGRIRVKKRGAPLGLDQKKTEKKKEEKKKKKGKEKKQNIKQQNKNKIK